MQYFNHDTSANSDMKICALRRRCGGAAVDAYWTILEMIYEAEEPLRIGGSYFTNDVIASRLLVDNPTLTEWVTNLVSLGLLERTESVDDGSFYVMSARAEENIENYHARVESARERGRKGGKRKAENQQLTKSASNSLATAKQQLSNSLPTAKLQPSYSLANKIKENKSVGSDQLSQTLASCTAAQEDAASADAANVAPFCSKCGLAVSFKPLQGKFECMTHGLMDRGEVVFR